MKLTAELELLVFIADQLNANIAERDAVPLTELRDWDFARGKVAATAKILDKARELGLPVESAMYLSHREA